jgi:hypothetical protein
MPGPLQVTRGKIVDDGPHEEILHNWVPILLPARAPTIVVVVAVVVHLEGGALCVWCCCECVRCPFGVRVLLIQTGKLD